MKTILFLALQCIAFFATAQIQHNTFDALLKKHVTEGGLVNYKGFLADSTEFNSYLKLLQNNPPDTKNWTKKDQLAYWINVYNAFTIKLILNHYPLKSIKDIKKGIPFVNTTWDIKFINIGGKNYDLNNIEHSIIRKKFKDNRIHFAVNCASISCPKLRNEAYIGAKLDAQLDAQARDFLADKGKNIITANSIQLSKLFTWYGTDFPKDKITYLNKYAPLKINANAEKSSLDYDWGLNEQ